VDGVDKFFGALDYEAISTNQAIFWLPTSDNFTTERPILLEPYVTTDGKFQAINTIGMRLAGVDLCVIRPDDSALADLVNLTCNAFLEACCTGTWANGEITSMQYLPRDTFLKNCVGYKISTFLKIPVYRFAPAANPQTLTLTTTLSQG
jgi:hypothetical protein